METLIAILIVVVLVAALRQEVLITLVKDLIENGITQKEEFEMDYTIPDESLRKIADIVLDELDRRKK